MWEEAATAALPAHDPPEILEADLSSLLLTCLLWGESDPTRLQFLNPPPAAALDEARARLVRIGAVDGDGRLTAHGKAIAAIPLDPRLAHMLIEARERGFGAAAAEVAVLLTERGLAGMRRIWRCGIGAGAASVGRGPRRRGGWRRIGATTSVRPERSRGTLREVSRLRSTQTVLWH